MEYCKTTQSWFILLVCCRFEHITDSESLILVLRSMEFSRICILPTNMYAAVPFCFSFLHYHLLSFCPFLISIFTLLCPIFTTHSSPLTHIIHLTKPSSPPFHCSPLSFSSCPPLLHPNLRSLWRGRAAPCNCAPLARTPS